MLTEMEILEANLANQQTVKIGQGKRTMTIQELALRDIKGKRIRRAIGMSKKERLKLKNSHLRRKKK